MKLNFSIYKKIIGAQLLNCFHITCSSFLTTTAELSMYDRKDPVAHKAEYIYYLALFRKFTEP